MYDWLPEGLRGCMPTLIGCSSLHISVLAISESSAQEYGEQADICKVCGGIGSRRHELDTTFS
jgi:hypothetical protein